MPISNEEVTWWMQVAGWVAGVFTSFIGGIVAATLWLSNKFNSMECKISSDNEQLAEQKAMLKDISKAIVKLHERIDDILLRGTGIGRERRRED